MERSSPASHRSPSQSAASHRPDSEAPAAAETATSAPINASDHNPFQERSRRGPLDGDFDRAEVRLAHRNHGMLLETLHNDITPAGAHYLLIHFDVPYVADAGTWSLGVTGCVDRPLTLSLDDLRALPERTLPVTLECAGNGRSLAQPRWPSQPWHHEAVGTGLWTGTPLKGVLERAGLTDDAVEIAFLGADRGFDAGLEHDYGRSLSIARALDDDVLLVWGMNGAPLLPQHGFPLRLIVPGWYGMASVKWLNRIEVLDHAFDGFQQTGTYHYKTSADDPGTPVTGIRVKSLMVPPGIPDWYTRERLVEAGPVPLFGRAWVGDGIGIASVDVGIDGVWHRAELDDAVGTYAWRGWRFTWDAAPGSYELSVRATDQAGNVQPLTTRYDRGGFGNNEVHRVAVRVR
ncbi:MAG: sulfite oxidase [Pseudomonadota bacterium]